MNQITYFTKGQWIFFHICALLIFFPALIVTIPLHAYQVNCQNAALAEAEREAREKSEKE